MRSHGRRFISIVFSKDSSNHQPEPTKKANRNGFAVSPSVVTVRIEDSVLFFFMRLNFLCFGRAVGVFRCLSQTARAKAGKFQNVQAFQGLGVFFEGNNQISFKRSNGVHVCIVLVDKAQIQATEYNNTRVCAYSEASAMPAAETAKVASASGRDGESNTVQMRFSPRPLRRRKRVVDAWAMMLPPMGFVASFAKLIPSGLATTWLVMKTLA